MNMPRGDFVKTAPAPVGFLHASSRAASSTWATISRTWNPGDRVEATIPQSIPWQVADAQHPEGAAIVRGAVVMPLEFR